eukprot:TRINITY_DN10834_c0_g1_i1.p1 TRINITY_DN10834_c0_g1~~TRINITY_DN10834_c0_g1_i1.p1  ORF type:complete len:188 (-),score=28.96 TRINITY_DN10834_c0_g1_i1:121-684(-)
MSFFSFFDDILNWIQSLFWKQEMELTLVGLQSSGKSSLLNVISTGKFEENIQPTVGFNTRKVTKGSVTIKLWDIGGQAKFRSMWERYCRGVNAIVFVVDAADPEKFEAAQKELHELISKPPLANIPLLVLGNKKDLPQAIDAEELIVKMNLNTITDRKVFCYSISAKSQYNIDKTLQWLIDNAKKQA